MQVTCLGQEVGKGQGEKNHYLISLVFINHLDFGQSMALEEKGDELSVKAKHQEHAKGQEQGCPSSLLQRGGTCSITPLPVPS